MSQPTVPDAPITISIPEDATAKAHPQRKLWCFTLFYDEEGRDIHFPTELTSCCTYLLCQRESCPDTRRTHVQGFLSCSPGVRFTRCKAIIQQLFRTSNSPRMAYIRGSVDDNVRYCTKLESRLPGYQPLELGVRPVERKAKEKCKATTLARQLIIDGKSPIDVLRDETLEDAWSTALRLHRSWSALLAESVTPRNILVDPVVIVLYGPPGTGKTKLAHELFPKLYRKSPGKWFDRYRGQSEILYDDFDGTDMTFTYWKQVLDRYPMQVEFKGGSLDLAATTHVITTNYWPSHWWSLRVTRRTGRDAIWRRITQVWDFHTTPPTVYDGVDQVEEYRKLPSNWALEDEDPKARPE